jgi:hypothetical protein
VYNFIKKTIFTAAESSLKLLDKINKHIKSTTSMVPYTVAQRSASMQNLMAMRYMYGMPSIFFTYAPDYVYGKLHIRMSITQNGIDKFPASGFGLTEALKFQLRHTILQCFMLRVLLLLRNSSDS